MCFFCVRKKKEKKAWTCGDAARRWESVCSVRWSDAGYAESKRGKKKKTKVPSV